MIFKWHFKWHISNWPSIIYVLPHLFDHARNLIFMIEYKNQLNIQKIFVWCPECHVFHTLNLCPVSFKQVLFFSVFHFQNYSFLNNETSQIVLPFHDQYDWQKNQISHLKTKHLSNWFSSSKNFHGRIKKHKISANWIANDVP